MVDAALLGLGIAALWSVAASGQKRPFGHHACRSLECLFVIGFSHWQLSQQTERNVDRCDGDN